ncbi:MAG TPA: DUF2330 domain-containing protein [Thermoanaerobaculia bacterium]|nr:DUF2330 domain-containing protein [Thermoanaerobaculia bacterium]
MSEPSSESRLRRTVRAALSDPRHFQLAVLGGLLAWGTFALDFPTGWGSVLAVGVGLGIEATFGRALGRRFDPRSPLITALSLSLLLRAASPWLYALAAAVAIGGKLVLRVRGKHLFNPATLGIMAAVLLTGQAWVSPGQWGSSANLAFLMACLGGLVVHRALRSDVTLAFLVCYAAVVLGRAAWLGDPWAIPLHTLDSGALVLFAFFMISDPKTTPDSRAGRVVFAAAVALGAAYVQFELYRPGGLVWSLFFCAPLVPLLDRLLPGERYSWRAPVVGSRQGTGNSSSPPQPNFVPEVPMSTKPVPVVTALAVPDPRSRRLAAGAARLVLIALVLAALQVARADAFCGFYVAKADAKLFNRASQVVIVRDGSRTVLTMANDYQGDPKEFALVVPVPTFLERGQIHVADQSLIDHLDAYTSPRLVEYHDPDPCLRLEMARRLPMAASAMPDEMVGSDAAKLGVRIEAKYTVGEYDILILSADESSGLETWLRRNGYRVPDGATAVLASYLKQGMRFFVAKVNLDEQSRLGYSNLRPLQIAFEHARFMLPIRLGTVNADGEQELFAYTLTRRGRVETTNYRTVRLPSDVEVPALVEEEFADFYRDMFARQVEREGRSVVFLEYAWDMAWCDPCAADPLSADQLRRLGVFWANDEGGRGGRGGGAQDVFVTRLHVRYTGKTFPEDLMFQETADRSNFQGRYVIRHPWRGESTCDAADAYRRSLAERLEREAQTLANLTGWELEDIRGRMRLGGVGTPSAEPPKRWWERLWPGR